MPVGAMAAAILACGAVDYGSDRRLSLGTYGVLFVALCLLAATLFALLRLRNGTGRD